MTTSVFKNCQAFSGGAVHITNPGAVSVDESIFDTCKAIALGQSGGAVYAGFDKEMDGSFVALSDCSMRYNMADSGAAIGVQGPTSSNSGRGLQSWRKLGSHTFPEHVF